MCWVSHLVCPLCGKNAPLSTLDPENLPLDVMAISFTGKGRGRGFAVKGVESILDDEEVTTKVAARVNVFYWFLVTKGLIEAPFAESDVEPYLRRIPELENKLFTSSSRHDSCARHLG